MNVITCPQELKATSDVTVFLAGGITGCPDWQAEILEVIRRSPKWQNTEVTFVNPRRSTFDVSNPAETVFQIGWEKRHLNICDIIFFWFPEETLCPITLYELGKAVGSKRSIIVGCHPGYKRRLDVIAQLNDVIDMYTFEGHTPVLSTLTDTLDRLHSCINDEDIA